MATSVNYTHKLGEGSSIAVGKFNPVDVYESHPFYGGWGIDRFSNIVLAAPPSGLLQESREVSDAAWGFT